MAQDSEDPDSEDPFLRILTEEEASVSLEIRSLEQAKEVAEAIRSNPRLKTLNLSRSSFGSTEHVAAVAAGLRGSSVTCLKLRCFDVGDAGVSAVAAVLGESSIQHLDLGVTGMGDAGAQALAEALPSSSVTCLDLSIFNHIGEAGAQTLAEALKSSSVTSLDLRGNSLADAGVAALAKTLKETQLLSLDVGNNNVGSAGVKALAAILKETGVATLGLSNNDIDDEGAEALLEGLRGSRVTEMLNLKDLRVEDETRDRIQAVLEANKAFFVLNMKVQQIEEQEMQLKFHTMGGNEVAVLTWSVESPVQDLPKSVLSSMHSPPFQGFSARNLKIVCPGGAVLDVGRKAASLVEQLGSSAES